MSDQEFIDIIDENDEVIGKTTYADIYRRLLPHRIVHILIFNDKDEMALQKRSTHKSFMPRAWSTTVGGHVRSGETYEAAALREMNEELGIKLPPIYMYKDLYQDKKYHVGLKKFLTTFKTQSNGPFRINPEEVETVKFFTLVEIWKMIKGGEKFHPELVFLLEQHFSN